MIKMVVFDMAGTTVDENNVVYKTLMLAINEKGINVALDEVLAEGAGKEKLQAIRSVLAIKQIEDETLAKEIFERFLTMLDDAYAEQDIFEQPNATNVFNALRESGIAVVLNTGYNRQTAEALITKIGWQLDVNFDCLITASDVELNRPNPDMILLAMSQLGITDGSEVAKVGDSAIDIEEGQNAGCGLSIGITTGAHTPEQLRQANPDYIIGDLIELLGILENANKALV
ncbi:phosphonatase-like hydrolase [Dyadobacter pollutisoli]|uniref:Phosphonatase-like hydrolase n=1 Tax=Dyadobacter pollutisoli TaxID=2910158 RepID=A0A9E8NDP5_9BACT|nr:phosphonatase-like hydrolase [Dyadobacter pollutisoli]WAC14795.1 phosphonatase-like hydrolase [Dyadobacter pollutisoli]